MIKEIKYGGFSANPNDHDGLEGDLAVAMNLIHEDNTIKPVMPPHSMAPIPGDPNLPNLISRKILCIHKTTEFTHYIVAIEYDSRPGHFFYLYWWDGTKQGQLTRIGDLSYRDIISVEPIGNTLVVLTSEGVHYLLWDLENRDNYKYLGQKPPRIDITFGLSSKLVAYPGFTSAGNPLDPIYFEGKYHSSVNERNIPTFSYSDYNNLMIPKREMISRTIITADWKGFDFSMEDLAGDDGAIAEDVKCMTDAALGAINKLVRKEGTEKGLFVMPFFVRYALEMYDRSLIMHSYPVLMVPNSRGPVFAMDMGTDSNDKPGFALHWNSDDASSRIEGYGRAYAFVSKLCYDAIFPDLDDWKDIIRKVNVYVSTPAYTYDQDGKVYGWKNMDDEGSWDSFYTIGKLEETNLTASDGYNADTWKRWQLSQIFPKDTKRVVNGTTKKLFTDYFRVGMPSWILKSPEPNERQMQERILASSTFYLIHSFDIDELSGNHSSVPMSGTIDIEKGALETLLARDTLEDDYFTRDTLIAKTCFAYNNRVNLAGVSRIQHKPLDAHIAWAKYNDGSSDLWNIAVKVKGQDRTNVLVSGSGQNDTPMPLFVYYPDPSATVAYVERGGVTHELKLTRHPVLLGAYWLGSLWSDADVPVTVGFPSDNAQPVKEYNAVYSSKVNNPFFFPSVGFSSITTGEIMALCSAVRPVSTGQMGYANLYIFADNGVWVAFINKDGAFDNVTLVTGDTCINRDSVTQLETAVLFTTDRGIMLISGSQAQCISGAIDDKGMAVEAMNEKIHQLYSVLQQEPIDISPFREFLQDCRMCYDYRGQRIIVYNPTTRPVDGGFAAVFPYAYIYSLESNKWGMMQSDIDYTLRAYPEALAVTHGGTLVNYSEAGDEPLSAQLLVTRPLTLDLPDVLKTVTTVLQRGLFRQHQGHVQPVLYGSRDLYNWHLVNSSNDENMRGRSGTPYKWFRVALLLKLEPGESITGCSIQYDTKYTNRLR